ncbi:uroporphyrinogen decarboxylase [Listeria ivanovii]|uniref:uroporphyrinogen decarboxylase n=1 Tax=Listeria ivanovii TaxID=1638 RepID=UPI000DA9D2B1|nr:uroporphyrinogen decarboxylase [Listeria ivanovii]PZF89313.1 uroporphyrinogen decarboxylase [Listeria ivanovii]PZF94669.1 uroporphyrinogen decarboxylase [Listeria ivanovii]PZG05189.1 uroporphyrinogen decarboxylase [Listeria ivanovii]PZG09861.1 uroporphyrinogen decarboxylase [Listeria ivanovii]PZG26720.1 uroporphyrinogen decarboxylase [Listeria ivanovii]
MTKITNDLFLKAARKENVNRIPVWYMRQAGRSQPEYRKLKEKYSLFEITHQPELCAYITKLPVEQYGVDAAILYKDIMTPLPGMGVDVEIKSGIGPVIHNPIKTYQDVERLTIFKLEIEVPYVLDTIKLLADDMLEVPLIGFAGAPFTLASYMIEGGPSKNYHQTKSFMYQEPEVWKVLMGKLGRMTADYLIAQINAGASAVQLFDSWVGALSRADYVTYIRPTIEKIIVEIKAVHPTTPIIMQAVGASHLLTEWENMPLDVVGVDWRETLTDARKKVPSKAIQGNLDPSTLLAPEKCIEETERILQEGVLKPGYIFNLGHGVFPEVSPEMLKKLTTYIHERSEVLLNKG